MDRTAAEKHRMAPLATPTTLSANATTDIAGALTALLADDLSSGFRVNLPRPWLKPLWRASKKMRLK